MCANLEARFTEVLCSFHRKVPSFQTSIGNQKGLRAFENQAFPWNEFVKIFPPVKPENEGLSANWLMELSRPNLPKRNWLSVDRGNLKRLRNIH